MSLADDLSILDATDQARLVRDGEVSATELVTAALERIEAHAALHAVVGLDPDQALARAAEPVPGALSGVPFLSKDLLPHPGLRAAMGSRLMAANVPAEHVPYTARIDQCGLITLAKTTSSELGLLGSTETALDGVTRSPWGPEWSAGGSSGGSAAAVAAGLVPLAHASDGGGSIRLPAALAGLFGFKPSAGATVAATPVVNDLVRLVSEHCVSRSVRDSALFLALTAATPADPVSPGLVAPLRIGVYDTNAFGERATPEASDALARAVSVCEALGHHVEEVDPPALSGRAISDGFFSFAGAGVAGLREMVTPMLGRPPGPAELEPFTLALVAWFDRLSAETRARMAVELGAQADTMRAFLGTVDVALCPTVGGPRPALGHLAPHLPLDVLLRRTERLAGYTAIHNSTGAPAMSVPLGWTDAGLPVGCQFAAAPGRDAVLLRLAYQLEEAAPWADRLPAHATGSAAHR